ncbi:MaoC family dehydratase [Arthrobacter sp. 35W]|uniref:MaoC family dehydratase n=1 Tax=Arthrobacter sp. 35W TaxID=1132441 RepID=UPI000555B208|nr:MaoC/PaaZ C-terminal domain-containing protein [Arthrobacter sp. 35W]
MPSLAKLYLNAAATAARTRVLGSTPSVDLPPRATEVHGVLADIAKMTEYQHLVGKAARDIIPSGYLHSMAFPVAMSVMVREDFPLPLLGMIHLRNQVEHLAPVQFSMPLSIRSWARNLAGHRAGTQVELVVEIRGDGGTDVLWRGVSTYLAKGVYLPGLDKPASAPDIREDFQAPNPTGIWSLGVDAGRAYAAVSGDFNPIHLSVFTAKALGMRRSIAHGMYLAARVLADVGSPKPEGFSWDISFAAPVFLPGTVAVRIADTTAADGSWASSTFAGWNARTGRKHFSGSVATLVS